jgi:hypothetical protein
LRIEKQNDIDMIYPIGIQNFEKIRTDGYAYVDKTAIVYDLVNSGSYYFLSRPRRFGKSLLLSTIEAYLSGKKELFTGLAIEKLEHEWVKYPILHLDLNTESYNSPQALVSILNRRLTEWEKTYGKEESEDTLTGRFEGIVRRAFEKTGQRVVILVDEYDKPLLQAIGNDSLQDSYRTTLKAFYSVLKTQDQYIRLAFLTGVTKFGKVSVFSDLNNLSDISMSKRYANICGITDKELHDYFDEPVGQLAEANDMTKQECYAKLKEQYDGYHFLIPSDGLYNPFSLLNTLDNQSFGDYWFETGTPSFLVQLLKNANYNLNTITETQLTADLLGSIDNMSKSPLAVIYQSGYLTIKSYDKEFKHYTLGFPNKEVENGFIRYLMPYYTPSTEEQSAFFISNFVMDVRNGHPDDFMQRLQTMFSDTDYKIVGKMELYFQNAMYVVFKLMGFYTDVERTTNRGRIDVLIKTKDYIYVMELKLDGSVEEALQQIEEKGYAQPFAQDKRKLYKIGVNFSSETRGIEDWKIVEG